MADYGKIKSKARDKSRKRASRAAKSGDARQQKRYAGKTSGQQAAARRRYQKRVPGWRTTFQSQPKASSSDPSGRTLFTEFKDQRKGVGKQAMYKGDTGVAKTGWYRKGEQGHRYYGTDAYGNKTLTNRQKAYDIRVGLGLMGG